MDKRFLFVVAGVLLIVAGIFAWKMTRPKKGVELGAVAFTSSRDSVMMNAEVQFDDQTPGASKWSWDFGDGSTGDGQSVSHAFTRPGVFKVTLTVNGSATSTKEVYVRDAGPGIPVPAAAISGPKVAFVGEKITMTLKSPSASNAVWKFGENGLDIDGQGQTVSYTYQNEGPYTIVALDEKTKAQSLFDIVVKRKDAVVPTGGGGGSGGGGTPAPPPAREMTDGAVLSRLQQISAKGEAAYRPNFTALAAFMCSPNDVKVTFNDKGEKTKDFNSYCKHLMFMQPTIVSVKQIRDPQRKCITALEVRHSE
ncbi:PKD domain-containing protein [Flaviaesturariibacter amylovorans]|uniref:PKD domain-containing protein n=1 Tax=Flaviaesturariibacter amylovorans TaxID=1084520 RepID=A0ABP8HRE9_9BACT